jgi:putative N6-adenine-specific DNA methylase
VEKPENNAVVCNAVIHNAVVYNAVALCAVGVEKVISNEIKKLGLTVIDSGFGKVRFRADTKGLYHALMRLRAADRVLLEVSVFHAADFDALFEGTGAVPWEQLIQAQHGLKIDKVRVNRSRLKAETSVQSIVHKAAAQRLCSSSGLKKLPLTGKEAEVRVYIEKDTVSLLLDLSGEPLFKRGYRRDGGIAPLRETTAAAMLLLSGWKRKYPLYDPFCGSCTILCEELMYAWDFAPGLNRDFAIDNLLIADNNLKEAVREELRCNINFERTIRIAGSDEDPAAVKLGIQNLERVLTMTAYGLQKNEYALPAIRNLPMREAHSPFSGEPGFIVANPPYGKRLGNTSATERLYGEMAALARHFPKWKLALITDHPGFESFFGKKANSCRELKNGPVSSYIFQYDGL